MTESSTPSNDAFNDSLSFIKKLWAGMQGMGMSVPTFSVEELDKRIQELRSVETWLNLNVSMLHNAIQALEIQRAAVSTLQSFSSALSQANQVNEVSGTQTTGHASQRHESHPENISPLMRQSAEWWAGMQEQFKQALGASLEKNAENYGAANEVVHEAMNEAIKTATKNMAAATTSPRAKSTAKTKAKRAAKGATGVKPRNGS